jgi:hypothetical protein
MHAYVSIPRQDHALAEQQKAMTELRQELAYYKERNEQMAKVGISMPTALSGSKIDYRGYSRMTLPSTSK